MMPLLSRTVVIGISARAGSFNVQSRHAKRAITHEIYAHAVRHRPFFAPIISGIEKPRWVDLPQPI